MVRVVVQILLSVIVAVVLVIAVGTGWWGHDKFVAAGPSKQSVTVVIPRGAGPESIAGVLSDNGVIAGVAAREIFTIGARLTNRARRMRAGEFPDGARVLRAKIDMAAGNMNLRDPVLYRILHAEHPRTGTEW